MAKVSIFEEHSEVSALWPDLGAGGETTIVCFDRHLDLKPLDPAVELALAEASHPSDLIRPLPLRGPGAGFGLDDFWAAGALCGLRTLIWVPPWPSFPGWQLAALETASLIWHQPGDPVAAPRVGSCCLGLGLCGLRVDIVPWNLLAKHLDHTDGQVVVDIDLDWLADEHGAFEHSVDQLAELVRMCDGPVQALTRSVRSGFLPSRMRSLAADVARALGATTREDSFLPGVPWPEDLLNLVHRRGPTDQLAVAQSRAPDEARGWITAMIGVAECPTNLAAAQRRFESAAGAGYPSSWLAYSLGAGHATAGRKSLAREWFRRAADIDAHDTMSAHARILAARCLDPRQDADTMLAELSDLARVLPYRLSLWSSVAIVADLVGDIESKRWAEEGLARFRPPVEGRKGPP